MPDALPMSRGATKPSTALCTAGIAKEIPTPASINAGRHGPQDLALRQRNDIHVSAADCGSRPVTAGSRSPKRPARIPPIGATTKSDTVHGIIRHPAPDALVCWVIAKYCAMKMSVPIMLMNMRRQTKFPARNWMDCINRPGTSASSDFVSQTKKAIAATAPIVSADTMAVLDQPAALPSDKPQTIAVMATVSSITPGQSIFETRRSLLGIRNLDRQDAGEQREPGTQNTQRQPDRG